MSSGTVLLLLQDSRLGNLEAVDTLFDSGFPAQPQPATKT